MQLRNSKGIYFHFMNYYGFFIVPVKKAECTKISPKKSFSNIPKYIPIPACGKDTSWYSIIHETFDEVEWYHHVSLNKTFVINNKNIFRSGQ